MAGVQASWDHITFLPTASKASCNSLLARSCHVAAENHQTSGRNMDRTLSIVSSPPQLMSGIDELLRDSADAVAQARAPLCKQMHALTARLLSFEVNSAEECRNPFPVPSSKCKLIERVCREALSTRKGGVTKNKPGHDFVRELKAVAEAKELFFDSEALPSAAAKRSARSSSPAVRLIAESKQLQARPTTADMVRVACACAFLVANGRCKMYSSSLF
jgi:hypothetical protein